MTAEVSNSDGQTRAIATGVVRSRKNGRRTIAPLRRRLPSGAEVPASGQIVFRSGTLILR